MSRKTVYSLVTAWLVTATLMTTAFGDELPAQMAESAHLFLASLSEEQAAEANFQFGDESRKDWHFVPRERAGLSLNDMGANQRQLAMALVQSAMSHRGFSTTMQIMALEKVLFDLENGNPGRDPGAYHFFIYGEPSTETTWAWRIEGHHLSISFTIVEGQHIETTPTFFGTNPAEVREGNLAGLRPLAEEEDMGRALLMMLSEEQRQQATFSVQAPRDIISGPGRDAGPLEPKGISASDMNDQQRSALEDLIKTHLGKFRAELAGADWSQIEEAGFENIWFAWAGDYEAGQQHYYRVQGPTFIFEYDNIQNDANHAHAVWRDFKNDFGEDLLRQHHARDHNETGDRR